MIDPGSRYGTACAYESYGEGTGLTVLPLVLNASSGKGA